VSATLPPVVPQAEELSVPEVKAQGEPGLAETLARKKRERKRKRKKKWED
jgi:hypothetical protein